MPQVDLIDETFIVAAPAEVAYAIRDRGFWAQLWPGLALTVSQNRGEKGIRWSCAAPLAGSAEVWLEPSDDGVIVHCYLRVDPPPDWSARMLRRESRRRELQVKRVMFALKDRLEGDRPPGVGRSSSPGDLPRSNR